MIFELNSAGQLYIRLQIETVVTEAAAGLRIFNNEGRPSALEGLKQI